MKKRNVVPRIFHYHELAIELHPDVYEPAEDSFLLLEALDIRPNDSVLELGTGSGLIALDCARRGAHVICSDINPFAVRLTRRNIERNRDFLKGSIEVRQGNLFAIPRNSELFDVIIFNPPYLPTTKKEKVGGWFDVATDGGRDGLDHTKRFIYGLKNRLSETGRGYFIFSSLSKRTTLEKSLKQGGFHFEICAKRLFEGEELDVYRVTPAD
jgi:release factor glutamine methyltransferase